MKYNEDKRTVITLDAGGTTFVFSAICGNKEVVEPVTLEAKADVLDECIGSLVEGFTNILEQLKKKGLGAVAISFAFPGPADYPNGIIGGHLPNFPSFRDGVALGPFLEDKFGLPVFINNDADLFAYGEAISGALPMINEKLKKAGSSKRYKNMLGYTFGTGFGMGVISNNELHIGDNSCVETFCLRNKKNPDVILEEGVSIRAVKRVYGELSGIKDHGLEPYDIYKVAKGEAEGNRVAAIGAFEEMGEIAGDAVSTAVTIIDGLVVFGGGMVAAHEFIYPALLRELRGKLKTFDPANPDISRLQFEVYDLDNEEEFKAFASEGAVKIKIYGTDKEVVWEKKKRIGIIRSSIGTSNAVAFGAYAFALNEIDSKR